jgi:hypothetical protein
VSVSVVAASTAQTAGATTTQSVSATPTLPAGTASGDRVFVVYTGTNNYTVPTGWTEIDRETVASGTLGAAAGSRILAVCYRDYDGVWTMPSFVQTSHNGPSLAVSAVTLRKGATEIWDTPTFTTDNDTTGGTSFSLSTPTTQAHPVGAVEIVGLALNVATTHGSTSLTASGVTFSGLTAQNNTNMATGNDVAHYSGTAPITGGATAADVFTSTIGGATTQGGGLFVVQNSLPGDVTITGSTALIGVIAPAGSVSADQTLPGATALFGLVSPAGSATAGADIAGVDGAARVCR